MKACSVATVLTFALSTVQAADSSSIASKRAQANGALCCAALVNATLPTGSVYFNGDYDYLTSLFTYFAKQETDVQPSCIVQPESAQDVSIIVKTLTSLGTDVCPFAIRGGGYTTWAGSANINAGVTIDFRKWTQASLSHDGGTLYTSPGSNWDDVNGATIPAGRSNCGSRATGNGVAGTTLGGGQSFFSPRCGFICDNVQLFEIVLASGEITQAYPRRTNPDQPGKNEDLFQALKGGSNNFGVVTRIDFSTFVQGQVWGGNIFYNYTSALNALEPFVELNGRQPYDEDALVTARLIYDDYFGVRGSNTFHYNKPIPNPPVFTGWGRSDIYKTWESLRTTDESDLVAEQLDSDPQMKRSFTNTITIKNDLPLLRKIVALWNGTLSSSTITKIDGIIYQMQLMPIPPAVSAKSALTGGNSLGISPSDGPLVIIQISASWFKVADDGLIETVAGRLLGDIRKEANKVGKLSPYVDLNYANKGQDVWSGRGLLTLAKLKLVSLKYDPKGVFQKQVPGGFKLPF